MKQNLRHKHGTRNRIIDQEEESMLRNIDKAIESSGNPMIIGQNGEILLRDFLKRYFPNTLRAETGHFISPKGLLSPQIDVMILDSRYPLLAENNDGTVQAMLHSVVATIEVKTRITTLDINKIQNNSAKIISLSSDVFSDDGWSGVFSIAFAYRSKNRIKTLAKNFFKTFQNISDRTDLYLLRVPDADKIDNKRMGVLLHYEADYESKNSSKIIGFTPMLFHMYTPLSDIYYFVVQSSYYCIAHRNYDLRDIGEHIMSYMSWSTINLSKLEKDNT